MDSTGYLTYISDMLSKHEAVVIPGFGGFITKYKSSKIESQRILPPTRYIAFNERLDIHDNTFARYLDERTTAHYSPRLFDKFVLDLKADLANNHVIVVPKVGRLYQDYEGMTHFMPDLLNLNNDTFGLPILSNEKGKWIESMSSTSMLSPVQNGLRAALASAATVTLLFALVFIGVPNNSTSDYNDSSIEFSIIDALIDSHSISEAPIADKAVAVEDEKKMEVAPVITLKPSFSSIIIVGAYGSSDNAVRMAKLISDRGFEPYQDQPGSLKRVGVKVEYSTQEELDTILTTIQKDITSRAWILK